MTFMEAMEQLKDGARIRRAAWPKHWMIVACEGMAERRLVFSDYYERLPMPSDLPSYFATDWEVVK
mgnify:CR=1 FL=1